MENAKLEKFNHWWIKGKVDFELALPFKREIYTRIKEHLKDRFIIALIGLRRVGKTTTAYQIIQDLIEQNISPENILFFSFDESSVKINEVLEPYKELHKKDFREEKVYVFFDEIQKCENWENELKIYYDLYPKLKFIITGSESLFIKRKNNETLAGRIFEFLLTTFNFREYLLYNKLKKEEFKYETKIKPFFIKFLEKGGFPETFGFKNDYDFKEYVTALVIDKIVYKDIPKTFKIEDPEFLKILLELIATNPGMYIDYLSLSKQFGKDRRVIKNYINYLKESFLIIILGNYRKNNISTLRKMKRAYAVDNGLSYVYKNYIDSSFLGKMAESLIVNSIKATSFWRNGNEIDLIYNDIPIEVKYQEHINSEDFKPLREFMKKFNKKEAILITKNQENKMEFEEGEIKVIPAWKWLLEIK